MKLVVEVKPAEEIRFKQMGDYYVDEDGTQHVEVGDTGNETSNHLLLLHELTEFMLVRAHGVPLESIDNFDEALQDDTDEPGEDADCPYFYEHAIAEEVERKICAGTGMSWAEHNDNVDAAWAEARARDDGKMPE